VGHPVRLGILIGSLRAQSHSRALAQTVMALAPDGVELSELPSIGDIPHYDADLQAQVIPDAVLRLGDAIANSTGVIIVMPEYNFSVPGVLKNALDWLSRLTPQPFAGKPVAIQTVSTGIMGGIRAQYHLRQTLVFLDARVLNKPEIAVPRVHEQRDVQSGLLTNTLTQQLVVNQIQELVSLA